MGSNKKSFSEQNDCRIRGPREIGTAIYSPISEILQHRPLTDVRSIAIKKSIGSLRSPVEICCWHVCPGGRV